MKKILSVCALIAVSFFLSSCSSDDDGGTSVNALINSWEMFEIQFEFSDDSGTVNENFSTESCDSPIVFTFMTGGDFNYSDFEIDFDEAIEGNLDLFCQVNDITLQGSWQLVSGNNYILNVEGESLPAQLNLSNSNNTLELILFNDQSDDPFDPFIQETTFRFNKS